VISELLGAAQSVQALAVLLKSAGSLNNYNEIVLAVSEVNARLMQANALALASQEQQSELSRRLSKAEGELAQLRSWSREAAELECIQIGEGVFAYLPKRRGSKFQAESKFCANCYLQSRPSLLQESREDRRLIGLHCPLCKTKVAFTHYLDAA